jgi:hypothetical protein
MGRPEVNVPYREGGVVATLAMDRLLWTAMDRLLTSDQHADLSPQAQTPCSVRYTLGTYEGTYEVGEISDREEGHLQTHAQRTRKGWNTCTQAH